VMKPSKNLQIDEKDLDILKILQGNARTPFLEIARKLGVSGATVHERVNRLVEQGTIQGFTTVLNPKKLDFEILALVRVTLNHPSIEIQEFKEALKSIPEIMEAHNVTGDTDIVLKVRTRNIDDLRRLLVDRIQYLKGVVRINSSIVLDSPVERIGLPL
ncbi:MAG: Lrp/AsnC family transcriptional regulator, partial [Candidatus Altiarchaeota archaeon]|nr:Lrp/AsnC family transcriptional regulator [Candidatus Altiarchaeota archaeon]